MENITERFEALESALHELTSQKRAAEQGSRVWRGIAAALAVSTLLILPLRPGTAQGSDSSLVARIAALEAKLFHFTRAGDDVFITGANLHIRNGSGGTFTTNGRGNLIVGYDEESAGGENRTGSHNLVVGPRHSFSSYGGLVAGLNNEISGPHASVSGGEANKAGGFFTAISGGLQNTTSNVYSSISGGRNNTASGPYASISGGDQNLANGFLSTISGGFLNRASGMSSSVSGGFDNTASDFSSSVSGGRSNTASAGSSSVSGGIGNTASGFSSSVSGGSARNAAGDLDWAAGLLFQDF